MESIQGETIRFKDTIRNVADDLELVAQKMRSIVQAMDEHLGPAKEDAHMAGLVGVMDDLVADVEEFAERANRLASRSVPASGIAEKRQEAAAA